MIADWKKEIAIAWYVQSETAKLDKRNHWEYHSPKVGATEHEINEVENTIGYQIDSRYREFLKFANGWPCFYQRVDLFGTSELAGGPLMESARVVLHEIAPEVLERCHVVETGLLPIAVSRTDVDLFVITNPTSSSPGEVIWFAGGEIDRFPSFDDYFLAMVDYNRVRYERLKNGEAA